MSETLEEMIERHEACVPVVYDDKTGKPLKTGDTLKGYATIGIGWNLHAPMPRHIINILRDHRINEAKNDCLHAFPWFADLSERRQWAMIDLCFNMGVTRLSKFKNFLLAMSLGDYESASVHLLDSDYAKQVKGRAREIADMLRGSEYI